MICQPWHMQLIELRNRNFPYRQIAFLLNKEGYRSATGKPLTGDLLKKYMVEFKRSIKPPPRKLEKLK